MGVDNTRLHLGVATDLHAESFGQPGSRTFRLLVRTGEGEVSVWLEKEQIAMLGSAIEDLLEDLSPEAGEAPLYDGNATFIGSMEVRAGTLGIGFDAERNGFQVEASDLFSSSDGLELESIAWVSTRSQFETVQDEVEDIVAASRPRCVLCGTPLTGEAHFCPPSNGHASVSTAE